MTTSNHTIPPMTHPISSGWDQPSRKDIVIIKDTAYMKQASFDKLSRRDRGFPTGVYEGKMWRCNMRLVWFIVSPKDESRCMTRAMDIKIVQTLPSVCTNCGEIGPHYVPPCMGDPGFFHCKPKDICKTCHGQSRIESSTSGRANGAPETVPCPTCIRDTKEVYDVRLSKKGTTEVTMPDGNKADIDRKAMEQAIDPHGRVFGGIAQRPVRYRRNSLPKVESFKEAVEVATLADLTRELLKNGQIPEDFKPGCVEIARWYDEEEAKKTGGKTHIVQYGSEILGYLSGPLPDMPPATPTVKFCTHAGTDESDIPDIGTLTSVLKILYPKRGIEEGDLKLYQPKEFKTSESAPNTYLVMHKGFIVGFLDGPLPPVVSPCTCGKAPQLKEDDCPKGIFWRLECECGKGTPRISERSRVIPWWNRNICRVGRRENQPWPTPSAWPTPPAGKLPPHAVIVPKEAYDHLDAPQPEHREIPPEEVAIIRIIEKAHHQFDQVRGTRMFPANVYQTPAEYAAYMIYMTSCHEFKGFVTDFLKEYNNGRCVRCGLKHQSCKKETP